METVAKANCVILADLLAAYGVRLAVLSPGSRNAPVSIAVDRQQHLRTFVVVDERTAAFAALGMAGVAGPVALVCTSGTALLNYAPAVAEAFYRRVPLIVVSADRPRRSIDQRDSQTIRQSGALAAIVRRSVDVPDDMDAAFANRLINDALQAAIGNIPGPVHINMPLGRPLTSLAERDTLPRAHKIDVLRAGMPDGDAVAVLCRRLTLAKSVLVVAGTGDPLDIPPEVAALPNVAFVADIGANMRGAAVVSPTAFDGVELSAAHEPEVILNLGGAIISDKFKAFLRRCCAPVINVGYDDCIVDTFGSLETTVEIEPQRFFAMWADNTGDSVAGGSDYRQLWRQPRCTDSAAVGNSDLAAVAALSRSFPSGAYFFTGNGMAARYSQLFRWNGARVFANRGVSGIDGCTSTAAGLSLVTDRPTVLLTGDTGAAYDIGALALRGLRPNFKIAVLDNGGGDIFRRVATTASLPERERLFSAPPHLPLRMLAQAYGFAYFHAVGDDNDAAAGAFFAEAGRPAILHFETDVDANRRAYEQIFRQI